MKISHGTGEDASNLADAIYSEMRAEGFLIGKVIAESPDAFQIYVARSTNNERVSPDST